MLTKIFPLVVIILIALFYLLMVRPVQKRHHQRQLDLLQQKMARLEEKRKHQNGKSPTPKNDDHD